MSSTWKEVRAAEFARIHGRPLPPDAGQNDGQDPDSAYARATFEARQAALCLSGGGIRSAAFCLGVLQSFGRAGLLPRFHYLSTVSGGGYIGAWLQTLMTLHGKDVLETPSSHVDHAIRALRGFTRYLSPQRGFLSIDTWTGATLYLRNLLINWMMVVPALMAVTVVAISGRTLFWWLHSGPPGVAAGLCCALAAAGLVFSVVMAAMSLPSHQGDGDAGRPGQTIRYPSPARVILLVVVPGLVWAFVVPLAAAPWWDQFTSRSGDVAGRGEAASLLWQLAVPAWFWLLNMVGFAIAAACSARRERSNWVVPALLVGCGGLTLVALWLGVDALLACCIGVLAMLAAAAGLGLFCRAGTRPVGAFVFNLWAWMLAAGAGALVVWVGLRIAHGVDPLYRAERVVTFAPAWLVLAQVLISTVFVAVRREVGSAEMDREWLARVSAHKMRVALLWVIYAAATLILPRLGLHKDFELSPFLTALGAGPVAAWLGKQAMSRLNDLAGKAFRVPWTLALNLLALVFGLLVAASLGWIADTTLASLQDVLAPATAAGTRLPIPAGTLFLAQALLLTTLVLLTAGQAVRVNVNRFSMHGVYRNRLMRAFIGAARASKAPDQFSNFDERDDEVRMSGLKPKGGQALFPVLGLTLNMSSTPRTDWADRKGAAFTVTPLHCGARELRDGAGAYVDSATYAGRDVLRRHHGRPAEAPRPEGISLATAMTISGAAVSPNWGYHTSPPLAFLMTMFNVRLGAWLPNPARVRGRMLQLARPGNALLPFLLELAGWSSDKQDAIYLSDGGHFDNLGLYEMLLRRCPLIVVIDAAADPECALFDLGLTLREAEIDQGIRVAFEHHLRPRTPRDAKAADETGGVGVGLIIYPDQPRPGILLLLKPDYDPRGLPVSITAYAGQHEAFPNESTADQWFTEGQFESYRALGAVQADQFLADALPFIDALLQVPDGDPEAAFRDCLAALKAAVLTPVRASSGPTRPAAG